MEKKINISAAAEPILMQFFKGFSTFPCPQNAAKLGSVAVARGKQLTLQHSHPHNKKCVVC